MDTQLKEEMYMNGRNQGEGRTIMRRYDNCSESGYNTCICKKDEKMFNVYSSD